MAASFRSYGIPIRCRRTPGFKRKAADYSAGAFIDSFLESALDDFIALTE